MPILLQEREGERLPREPFLLFAAAQRDARNLPLQIHDFGVFVPALDKAGCLFLGEGGIHADRRARAERVSLDLAHGGRKVQTRVLQGRPRLDGKGIPADKLQRIGQNDASAKEQRTAEGVRLQPLQTVRQDGDILDITALKRVFSDFLQLAVFGKTQRKFGGAETLPTDLLDARGDDDRLGYGHVIECVRTQPLHRFGDDEAAQIKDLRVAFGVAVEPPLHRDDGFAIDVRRDDEVDVFAERTRVTGDRDALPTHFVGKIVRAAADGDLLPDRVQKKVALPPFGRRVVIIARTVGAVVPAEEQIPLARRRVQRNSLPPRDFGGVLRRLHAPVQLINDGIGKTRFAVLCGEGHIADVFGRDRPDKRTVLVEPTQKVVPRKGAGGQLQLFAVAQCVRKLRIRFAVYGKFSARAVQRDRIFVRGKAGVQGAQAEDIRRVDALHALPARGGIVPARKGMPCLRDRTQKNLLPEFHFVRVDALVVGAAVQLVDDRVRFRRIHGIQLQIFADAEQGGIPAAAAVGRGVPADEVVPRFLRAVQVMHLARPDGNGIFAQRLAAARVIQNRVQGSALLPEGIERQI